MTKLEEIDHIAIQVKSIKNSVDWYTKKYKCKVIYADETWGFVQFKNIKLAMVTHSEHPPHFAILDKSIKEEPGTVKHRDGSISKYIKDLDGNFIELIKY